MSTRLPLNLIPTLSQALTIDEEEIYATIHPGKYLGYHSLGRWLNHQGYPTRSSWPNISFTLFQKIKDPTWPRFIESPTAEFTLYARRHCYLLYRRGSLHSYPYFNVNDADFKVSVFQRERIWSPTSLLI